MSDEVCGEELSQDQHGLTPEEDVGGGRSLGAGRARRRARSHALLQNVLGLDGVVHGHQGVARVRVTQTLPQQPLVLVDLKKENIYQWLNSRCQQNGGTLPVESVRRKIQKVIWVLISNKPLSVLPKNSQK